MVDAPTRTVSADEGMSLQKNERATTLIKDTARSQPFPHETGRWIVRARRCQT